MKKELLLISLLVPLMGYTQTTTKEEPFYQYNFENYIITANIGVQLSTRQAFNTYKYTFFPSIPINVDVFYRYTSANIFGYSGFLVEIPFFNDRTCNNIYKITDDIYGGVFIGIGWYVFDHRDTSGIGWSMMQALAGGFYIFPNHLGGGGRFISRFNYGFQENIALNIGLDFDYNAAQFSYIRQSDNKERIRHFDTFNFGLNLGITFYLQKL